MRSFIRRTTTLALLGALAVGSGLPAAAQSGQVQSLSQRQSILTELSNTGEAGTSRVFTQLKATGSGEVAVTLPQQSTRGLRNLEGFGKPDVNGDDVVWTLDASKDGFARSVADNTADLPVSVSVVYRLDGQEVAPKDLAGRTGKVEVEYTVRNLTAEPREVISFDAENNKFTETMDIAVPMVGSLSLTLPASFANIDAPGGVTVGDGRGNTVINYSLLLFAPLGSEEQTVTWSADAVDTAIPETSIQVLPVDDTSFNSLNATADAYKGASSSLSELANGALIINSNLLLLGSGASQLLDGLNQLADGAGQLNDGLANTAAPGARQLSDGMSAAREGGGKLSTGLGELALGATRLSNGLNDARAGGRQLAEGLGKAAPGSQQLADGLSGVAAPGAQKLADGLAGTAAPGAEQINAGLAKLLTKIGKEKDSFGAGQETLIGGLNDLVAGSQGTLATGTGALEALSAGLAGSFGPDATLPGNPHAGQKAAAAAAGATSIQQGIGGIKLQAGTLAPFGIDHLVYGDVEDKVLCLGAAPLLAPDELAAIPGGIAIPAGCFTDTVAVGIGFAGGMAELNATLTALGSEKQVSGDSFATLDALLTRLSTGAGELNAGLQAQATSLGDTWPTCEAAIAAAEAFAGGGAQPTGLQVIRALQCISAQVNAGVTTQIIPGLTSVRGGVSNPAAFNKNLKPGYNPECKDATAENKLQPCGLVQALTLLEGGSGALASGLDDAASGAGDLAAGIAGAASGAGELAAGIGAAATGSSALSAGLGQLADGGGQLAAGAGTAASGSRDLASGLVQLDDGAAKLANGLGDAADGSGKLADGLDSAEEGGEKIANGVGALQEGFEERLIGGISGGRQGASQDYEQVKAVIQRGREGAAPYGIADGADATTVFQFDLAGVGTEEGPSTLLLVVLALAALGAAAGLGLALRQRLTA